MVGSFDLSFGELKKNQMMEPMESSSDSEKTNVDPKDLNLSLKASFYVNGDSQLNLECNEPSSDDTVIVSDTSTDVSKSISGSSLKNHPSILINETSSDCSEIISQIQSTTEDSRIVEQVQETKIISKEICYENHHVSKTADESEMFFDMNYSSKKSPTFELEDMTNDQAKPSSNIASGSMESLSDKNSNCSKSLVHDNAIKTEDKSDHQNKEVVSQENIIVTAKNRVVISSDDDDGSDIIEVMSSDDDVVVVNSGNKEDNSLYSLSLHPPGTNNEFYSDNMRQYPYSDMEKGFSLSVSATAECFATRDNNFPNSLGLMNDSVYSYNVECTPNLNFPNNSFPNSSTQKNDNASGSSDSKKFKEKEFLESTTNKCYLPRNPIDIGNIILDIPSIIHDNYPKKSSFVTSKETNDKTPKQFESESNSAKTANKKNKRKNDDTTISSSSDQFENINTLIDIINTGGDNSSSEEVLAKKENESVTIGPQEYPPSMTVGQESNDILENKLKRKKHDIVNWNVDNSLGMQIYPTDIILPTNNYRTETNEKIDIEMSSVEHHSITSLQNPELVGAAYQEFKFSPENHLRGCLWSPDGSCVLTNSDDDILRLFNISEDIINNSPEEELKAQLKMSEGETIYDMSWYPYMNSSQPDTCLFLTTSRDHPIHLWDTQHGVIRCTYKAHNQLDELASAYCVSFNLDGSKIYCGFNKCIRVFDSSRPGNECVEINTDGKRNQLRQGKPKRMLNQTGIISSISFSTSSGLYALGSFSKTVGLYDTNDGKIVGVLNDHSGGVTQVKFTNDGYYVISGARKDSEIIWWDLRNTTVPLFKLLRDVSTNQRIQFDIDRDNMHVFSGSTDNQVHIWDLKTLPDEIADEVMSYGATYKFHAHNDAVNAVSLHPTKPLLASTSGQRHFYEDSDSNTAVEELSLPIRDNSLKIWKT